MLHVHFNIGSNLGDREDNIKRAVASLLRLASDLSSVRVSEPVVSEPWGFESANAFVNVGVSLDTELSPERLLQATQAIERSISTASHRDAAGGYIDRLIDIDIIAAATPQGALVELDNERLTLPHPRALQRDFVITPLRSVDPGLYTLLSGTTAPSGHK